MSGTKGHTRWTPGEYLQVAVNSLHAIDAGRSRLEILKVGMRAGLPRNRWRTIEQLSHLCYPSMFGTFEKYVGQARAMSSEERAKYIPQAPAATNEPEASEAPPPPHVDGRKSRALDVGRDYTGQVRWTDHEKARLARMVRYWLDNNIDKRNLGRLLIEAQELVLPPERRRATSGLRQGNSRSPDGGTWNEKILRDGETSVYLIAHEKFHADGEYGPKAEARKAQEQRDAQEQRERSLRGAFVPPTTIAEVKALDARLESDDGTMFEIPAELFGEEGPPPQPVGTQNVLPFPRSTGTLAEASRVFGDTVMNALEKLLTVHTNALMQEFNARIASTAASTGAAIAMQIEQTMRGTVQTIINEELGNSPSPPPAEPEKRKLKVDVVGFEMGAHEQAVRQVCDGIVDVRFVHPDQCNTYAPHRGRHVIIVQTRIPHSLGNKIKAAGVEPLYVRRTTGHVIHAIEELMRSEGIEPVAA